MSHELRHPIHVIQGICDNLLDFDVDEQKRQAFIQDIRMEAGRLGELVEKIRIIDKAKSQFPVGEFQRVNLADLGARIVRVLTRDAEKKGLILTFDCEDEEIFVQGNPDGLMQVMTNLVVNAINYTLEGNVKVSLVRHNDIVNVSISDTGVGIARSELNAVFKRFYRDQKNARKVRGHGLGLSIVRDILQVHGCKIKVESKLGQGSRFYFNLPLIP